MLWNHYQIGHIAPILILFSGNAEWLRPDWQVREELAPTKSSSSLFKTSICLACMEVFLRSQAFDHKGVELVICSEPPAWVAPNVSSPSSHPGRYAG